MYAYEKWTVGFPTFIFRVHCFLLFYELRDDISSQSNKTLLLIHAQHMVILKYWKQLHLFLVPMFSIEGTIFNTIYLQSHQLVPPESFLKNITAYVFKANQPPKIQDMAELWMFVPQQKVTSTSSFPFWQESYTLACLGLQKLPQLFFQSSEAHVCKRLQSIFQGLRFSDTGLFF